MTQLKRLATSILPLHVYMAFHDENAMSRNDKSNIQNIMHRRMCDRLQILLRRVITPCVKSLHTSNFQNNSDTLAFYHKLRWLLVDQYPSIPCICLHDLTRYMQGKQTKVLRNNIKPLRAFCRELKLCVSASSIFVGIYG